VAVVQGAVASSARMAPNCLKLSTYTQIGLATIGLLAAQGSLEDPSHCRIARPGSRSFSTCAAACTG
jgi:hypothetical protein